MLSAKVWIDESRRRYGVLPEAGRAQEAGTLQGGGPHPRFHRLAQEHRREAGRQWEALRRQGLQSPRGQHRGQLHGRRRQGPFAQPVCRRVGDTRTSFMVDSKDPACLENLAPVNNTYSWIKRYLRRFPGMEMNYLQGHSRLVCLFRVNQAKAKWPQTQRVIQHLMLTRVDSVV